MLDEDFGAESSSNEYERRKLEKKRSAWRLDRRWHRHDKEAVGNTFAEQKTLLNISKGIIDLVGTNLRCHL